MTTNATPLQRSATDRWIGGVLGGIAARYGWDPFVLRMVYLAFSVFSAAFPGILVYLILWVLMPMERAR